MEDNAIFNRIEVLAGEDNSDFEILRPATSVDATKPLYILVHPGDVVQKPDDVMHSEDPGDILDYSLECQNSIGSEMRDLDWDAWDIVVLHRMSSDYALSNLNGVDSEFMDMIDEHADSEQPCLYGDDLEAASRYLLNEMNAASRPAVVVTGAWAEKKHGCVAMVGSELEKGGAAVYLSSSACISPDGEGEKWMPAKGDILFWNLSRLVEKPAAPTA